MGTKEMILCDSNVLFDYFHEEPAVTAELERLGFERLALSAATVAETYFGMKKGEIRQTKELIRRFNVIHIDKHISKRFLNLLFTHYGRRLSLGDALIAATALDYGIPLYTDNVQDFVILEGIKLHKPVYAKRT
jgi:tRNA(fMet)-specific endonuclease VapC